ncbi:MAG TPA: DUF6084 family protein [Candidatus Limnocylindrales bacterium]|jgi:hypothetical protein|nr:DUF6084 family protein [Candidatus Limnocylindrales bacterium]
MYNMPDLNFQVTDVESASHGLTPVLDFKLRVTASPATELIQGLLLNAQIQIQAPQRAYSDQEKEKLFELFGPPQNWGQTLRNRLWTHANVTVGAFTGAKDLSLPVPCSFDLNIAATKYFYGLGSGDVSLLFLFSGSLFYATAEGRLQVERISWSKECVYRMPVALWRQMMDQLYPNCGWLYLERDVLDRLYAYRRRHALATWDQTIATLLNVASSSTESPAPTPEPVEVSA